MISSAGPEDYARTIAAVGNDPNVDAIVATHVPTMVSVAEDIGRGIARGVAEMPPEKPVLVVYISSQNAPASLHEGRRGSLPCYVFPENAALAIAAASRYSRWRRRPRGKMFELEPSAYERWSIGRSRQAAVRHGFRPRTSPPCSARRGSATPPGSK
jgi:acyl-CoA synthetase (NDP forming)